MTKLSPYSIQNLSTEIEKFLSDYSLMDQKSTNLCGIVSTFKVLTELRQDEVRKFLYELIENGSSRGVYLNHHFQSGSTWGINELHRAVYFSLRSSLNFVLPYNPKTDKGFHGFTWPNDVCRIFRKFNVRCIRSFMVFPKRNFLKIQQALSTNSPVIALFDWRKFKSNKRSVNEWHYVQILSLERQNSSIHVKIWNPNGAQVELYDMPLKQFYQSIWIWWRVEV